MMCGLYESRHDVTNLKQLLAGQTSSRAFPGLLIGMAVMTHVLVVDDDEVTLPPEVPSI